MEKDNKPFQGEFVGNYPKIQPIDDPELDKKTYEAKITARLVMSFSRKCLPALIAIEKFRDANPRRRGLNKDLRALFIEFRKLALAMPKLAEMESVGYERYLGLSSELSSDASPEVPLETIKQIENKLADFERYTNEVIKKYKINFDFKE